jgi:hypothetical protein
MKRSWNAWRSNSCGAWPLRTVVMRASLGRRRDLVG